MQLKGLLIVHKLVLLVFMYLSHPLFTAFTYCASIINTGYIYYILIKIINIVQTSI